MHPGGVGPPGNPPHKTGFDPTTGQQKSKLLDRLREALALAAVGPPDRANLLPPTPLALVPERTACHTFRYSFATIRWTMDTTCLRATHRQASEPSRSSLATATSAPP